MKLRILSDIHTEFWKGWVPEWYNTPNDIVILAGDIAVGPNKLKQVLEHFSAISNHVIYVFGNHEYYGYKLNSYDNLEVPSNVHVLNPGCVTINDVVFAGATLWTDFHNDPTAAFAAAGGITDFKRIKLGEDPWRFTPKHCSKLFLRDYKFLLEVNKLPQRKVFITHFVPHSKLISPYWKANGGLLNKYFAPNLPLDVLTPELWVYGHTHDCSDQVIGNTRFIANPYGYYNYEKHENFNPNYDYVL